MVTDDDRRRVAKELRDFFPIDLVSELTDVDCHLATMVMGDKFCPSDCLWCFETVCSTLADLIDPGESGQNRDTNRDTVQIEYPAVPKAPETCEHWLDGECYALRTARPVDREALLALAEEMKGHADAAASADGYPYVNAGELWSYADRIREALGVSE